MDYHLLISILSYHPTHGESKIDPDDISAKFEKVAEGGIGAITSLYRKIREGKDSVSERLKPYIPTEEDYVVEIGSKSYPISRALLTKPEIEKAKEFVSGVASSLPGNYKGRAQILESIAANGIRSEQEMISAMPDLYMEIKAHIA